MIAIKIFAVLVNSMPDERTGSKFTWFNSPLRGNQHGQTLVDMVQIGQFYARKVCPGRVHTLSIDLSSVLAERDRASAAPAHYQVP